MQKDIYTTQASDAWTLIADIKNVPRKTNGRSSPLTMAAIRCSEISDLDLNSGRCDPGPLLKSHTLDESQRLQMSSDIAWRMAGTKWILSRDYFDFRPLYFSRIGDLFFVCRHIGGIVKFIGKAKIDRTALFDWMVLHRAGCTANTMFSGISQLLQGHELVVDVSDGSIGQNVIMSDEGDSGKLSFEERTSFLMDRLKLGVERSIHDGCLTGLMSGGVDSTLLHALGQNLQVREQHALTVLFDKYSTGEEAGTSAVWSGYPDLRAHVIRPTSRGWVEDLEDLHRCIEEPTWSSGSYIQYVLYRRARQLQKSIIMDGTGGDALFGGHLFQRDQFYLAQLKSFRWLSLLTSIKETGMVRGEIRRVIKSALKYCLIPQLPASARHRVYWSYWPDLKYFRKDFINDHFDRIKVGVERYCGDGQKMMLDQLLKGQTAHLRKFPFKCAAHFGLRSSTPFLDDASLVRAALLLPFEGHFEKGFTKYALRQLAEPYLPETVVWNKHKMPMSCPNNQWISEFSDRLRPYIFDTGLEEVIDVDRLERDYSRFFDIADQPETFRHFKFFSLGIWKKVFDAAL